MEESYMQNRKNDRKKLKTLVKLIILVIVLASLFYLSIDRLDLEEQSPTSVSQNQNSQQEEISQPKQNQEEVTGEMFVHMIDVGQADSFLFVQGENTMLIDCGTRGEGDDVVSYLQELGIEKIDVLVGSHPHDDHMGGMKKVIDAFEVSQIYVSDVSNCEITSNWYATLWETIMEENLPHQTLKNGDHFNVGQMQVELLAPIAYQGSNINNYSLVMKVSFGQTDILMTGDAETEIEEEILALGEDLDVEVLKMGHHGSDTSSSEAFMQATSPEYVLISAGIANKYHHPCETTMQYLEDNQIPVYRTDESGTVIMETDGKTIRFDKKPGDYLSGDELEQKKAA